MDSRRRGQQSQGLWQEERCFKDHCRTPVQGQLGGGLSVLLTENATEEFH